MWGDILFPNKYQFSLLCSSKNKSNNIIVSLGTIINGNVNVLCCDSDDVVSSYLRSISKQYFSSLILLHAPMEEHDDIMDENN